VARFEELAVWKRSARLSADLYKSLRDPNAEDLRAKLQGKSLKLASSISSNFEITSRDH